MLLADLAEELGTLALRPRLDGVTGMEETELALLLILLRRWVMALAVQSVWRADVLVNCLESASWKGRYDERECRRRTGSRCDTVIALTNMYEIAEREGKPGQVKIQEVRQTRKAGFMHTVLAK